MATETGDAGDLSPHVRGVTVTTVATVMGVLAGVGAAVLATGPTDRTGLYLLVGAFLIQLPLLRGLGVDVTEFGVKDNLYLVFMTFSLWFVTWAILLTAGVGG